MRGMHSQIVPAANTETINLGKDDSEQHGTLHCIVRGSALICDRFLICKPARTTCMSRGLSEQSAPCDVSCSTKKVGLTPNSVSDYKQERRQSFLLFVYSSNTADIRLIQADMLPVITANWSFTTDPSTVDPLSDLFTMSLTL